MSMEIKNDRLHIDGRPASFVASPNKGGRIEPTLIVLHDTADRLKPGDTISWFQNPKAKVSAHFVVARDGSITQMIDCDRAAWHAGESSWHGRVGCNGFAIGIEIDNPGKLTPRGDKALAWYGEAFSLDECERTDSSCETHGAGAWLPYTEAQLAAVEALVAALGAAYPSIKDVAGHFEISPGRKVDPGPQFPMARMAAALGYRAAPDPDAIADLQLRLAALGYPVGAADGIIGARTRGALRIFQEQNGLDQTGSPDKATMVSLMSGHAKGMPLAHRENITREDLAHDHGSSTIRLTSGVKRTSELVGAVALGLAGANSGDTPEVSLQTLPDPEVIISAAEKNRNLGERLIDLVAWAQTRNGLLTIAAVALLTGIWMLANKAEWRRVLKARLGLG